MEVKGWHDPTQTFVREVAGAFKRCNVPERRANFAVDKNVSVACLRTEPSGKVIRKLFSEAMRGDVGSAALLLKMREHAETHGDIGPTVIKIDIPASVAANL